MRVCYDGKNGVAVCHFMIILYHDSAKITELDLGKFAVGIVDPELGINREGGGEGYARQTWNGRS